MTSDLSEREFSQLLVACQELASMFPEGLVFIGGIAVYLHTQNTTTHSNLAETTHDADFYISIADMSDLRDLEEVTQNRRLNRHQLIKRGFEFDIYTERYSALIVPYDQIVANALNYEKLKVACLEHLIVLKLEAYLSRQASAKGLKDAKDLIRIALISQEQKKSLRKELISGYLSDEHLELLKRIARGPEMLGLARGNAKLAKSYRELFSKAFKAILTA